MSTFTSAFLAGLDSAGQNENLNSISEIYNIATDIAELDKLWNKQDEGVAKWAAVVGLLTGITTLSLEALESNSTGLDGLSALGIAPNAIATLSNLTNLIVAIDENKANTEIAVDALNTLASACQTAAIAVAEGTVEAPEAAEAGVPAAVVLAGAATTFRTIAQLITWGETGYNAVSNALGAIDSGFGFIAHLIVSPAFPNDDPIEADVKAPVRSSSDPILLDLSSDGSGITTTALSTDGGAAFFDYGQTGFAQATGWAGASTGILVFSPYFSDTDAPLMVDGFQQLQQLAGGANSLTPDNPLWNQLMVWIGSNGEPGSGTFETLTDAGIASINLVPAETNQSDANGAVELASSTFSLIGGETRTLGDYSFLVSPTNTIEDDMLPVPEDITALPEILACGTVYDLSQAMVRDDSLAGLVEEAASSGSISEVGALVTQILQEWTGADATSLDSTASFMDAEKLYVVEQFRGAEFSDSELAALNATSVGAAQAILNQYDKIYGFVFGALVAQGSLSGLWDNNPFNMSSAQTPNQPDFVATTSFFDGLLTSDKAIAANKLALFAEALNGLGLTATSEYSVFKAHVLSEAPDLGQILSAFDGTNNTPMELGLDAPSVIESGTNTGGFLFGFSGNDVFESNGGNVLEDFGSGSGDTYSAATGDTIKDVSGIGSVTLNGVPLTGGAWSTTANGWVDSTKTTIYQLDGSGNVVVSAYDAQNNRATGPVLLTIAGLQLSASDVLKSWLNMGFSSVPFSGGSWNPLTNQFESASVNYSVNADGSLTVTSVADPTQSVTLPNASQYLGTSGTSPLHLTNGPSQFDTDYVNMFDALALMVGPQGSNQVSLAQINLFISERSGYGAKILLQGYLGFGDNGTPATAAALGQAVLNQTAQNPWGQAYAQDRAAALLQLLSAPSLMGPYNTVASYYDESSGLSTVNMASPQQTQVYFGSASDTLLTVGNGETKTRVYSESNDVTITGDASLENDYYALVGDTIVDPVLNGVLHLPTWVNPSSVSFSTSGVDLVISIAGSGAIVVKNWLARGSSYVPLHGGITNGSFTWTQPQILQASLNQYANDTSADQQTSIFAHNGGFTETLYAGIGDDLLYAAHNLVDPVTGRTDASRGTNFVLGSGSDTIYGNYGNDQINVASPTGQASVLDESGVANVNFGQAFLQDDLYLQLSGNQIVVTDSEGGSIAIAAQTGPSLVTPDGHRYLSSQLYEDALAASQRKSTYEYLYDPSESGTESQFASVLEGLDGNFTQYAAAGYFDNQLARALTAGYDVRGIEDGVSSVRYQDGQEIKTYGFSAVERTGTASQYDAHAYVWETVTFDLWKDSSGVEHYALDNESSGYGTTVGTGSLTTSYSESPTQVLIQQRDTRFQLFGTT
jgi:hypothetical protein